MEAANSPSGPPNWLMMILAARASGFLKGKDRYVDCFSFLEIDYDRILEAAEYKGTIKEEHMEEIIELLKTAPRVKANKLKKYGL